jgi:hypothetical protein
MRFLPAFLSLPLCASIAASVAATFSAGCSGQTSNPGPGPGPACTATLECPSSPTDLSGTWDIVGMNGSGAPEMGTISIASNVFVLTIGGAILSYAVQNGNLNVSYTPASDAPSLAITTTRSAAAFSGGIMPVDLGGTWSFLQAGTTCTVNVGAPQIDGTCTRNVSGAWPDFLGRPQAGVTYVAHKMASGTSQFGDLSGTWLLSENDDTSAPNLSVSFMGSTISASGGTGGGSATLSFNGNGDASGSTSGGIEYTGHRR